VYLKILAPEITPPTVTEHPHRGYVDVCIPYDHEYMCVYLEILASEITPPTATETPKKRYMDICTPIHTSTYRLLEDL